MANAAGGHAVENAWPGTLSSVSFLGSYWRYQVDLDAGVSATPGVTVEGTAPAMSPPGRQGDRCVVQVRPQLIRLLDALAVSADSANANGANLNGSMLNGTGRRGSH